MIQMRHVSIRYAFGLTETGELLESAEDVGRRTWPTHCTTVVKEAGKDA